MMTPEQLRAKLASELAPPPQAPQNVARLASQGHGGQTVSFTDLKGRSTHLSVPNGTTVGGVISRAIGVEVVLPVDQTGAVQGWYRLRQGGRTVEPMEPAGALAAGMRSFSLFHRASRTWRYSFGRRPRTSGSAVR